MFGIFKRQSPKEVAQRINTVVDNIVTATEKKLEEARADNKPLFLLVGENHSVAAHKLVYMLLLKRLKDKGHKITFGIEDQNNFLEACVASRLHKNPHQLRPETKIFINNLDTNKQLSLKATKAPYNSKVSNDLLNHFLIKENIRVTFNDAARIYGTLSLDIEDPEIVKTTTHNPKNKKNPSEIDVLSREGMYIRNKIMVRRAIEFANNKNVAIHIQHCGFDHLFGNKYYPQSESLSALLKKEKQHILSASLSSYSQPGFFKKLFNNIVADTTIKARIFYNYDNDGNLEQEERAWLKDVMQHLDLDIEILNNLNAMNALYEEEVIAFLDITKAIEEHGIAVAIANIPTQKPL